MKKLDFISKQLNQDVILNPVELANIRGGRRYLTKDPQEAKKLFCELESKGENVHIAYHDGTYCIEW